MHFTDVSVGLLGENAIVGAGLPIACGAAFTAKMRKTDQVALTFFGEGATNQGVFHEALNLAAIWELPVIFFCENNIYAEMTPIAHEVKVERMAARAEGNGITSVQVDGNRNKEEVDTRRANDPIARFKQVLQNEHSFSTDEIAKLESDAVAAVDDAENFARSSPLPDPSTALEYIYA